MSLNIDTKSLLGSGVFGNVYKAHDVERDVMMAAKVFSDQCGDFDGKVFQCKLEYGHMRALQHKNIVKAVAMIVTNMDAPVVLLMELAQRGDLHSHIRDHSGIGLPTPFIMQVFKGICDGLMFLHNDKSIVHGDIKPENILVDGNDNALLCDFDAALPVGTHIEEPRGTRDYHPPEYVNHTPEQPPVVVTAAVDVWAVGMCLLMMVTGMEPENVHAPGNGRYWTWQADGTETRKDALGMMETPLRSAVLDILCKETPTERPSITDVRAWLEEDEFVNAATAFHETWTAPVSLLRQTDSVGRRRPRTVAHTDLDDDDDMGDDDTDALIGKDGDSRGSGPLQNLQEAVSSCMAHIGQVVGDYCAVM